MADFWIKLEKSTPDKPEVFEIASILDIDPDCVLGKLVRAWAWIDSNSENGHISSVTNVLIDRVTACDGFAKAMRQVGWLSDDEVPNFDRHMGKSAKKRANDAERKRKSRKDSEKCHAESVTESGLDKSRVDNKEKKAKALAFASEVLDLYEPIILTKCNAKGFFKDSFLKSNRVKPLLARISENEQHKSLEFWQNYFDRCCDIKWIRDGIDGEAKCTIDMLVNKTKFYRHVEEFWA